MRKSKGQVALALNIIIAIFVVGSLGFMSYEMSRILLAREQLKHCLELASLAGGASMASTSATGTQAQQQAITIAQNILGMNSILGGTLNGNVVVASSSTTLSPAPGQTAVFYEFDDPVSQLPSPTGNVMRIYGAYAYPLFSGGFGSIGVNTYTLMAQAVAGMPAVDLVIVDNISGSMDDQTNVTLVRRHWDQTTGNNIIYSIPESGPGGGADGSISGVVCPPVDGSQVNGVAPQNLDAAGDPRTSNCPKEFSETGNQGNTVPLRGVSNNMPPGDAPAPGGVGVNNLKSGPGNNSGNNPNGSTGNITFNPMRQAAPVLLWSQGMVDAVSNAIVPPATAHYTDPGIIDYETTNTYGANNPLFTDLVVNLDGNPTFGGYTDPNYPNYPFPGIDALVEASRGTMENGGTTPTAWVSNNLTNLAQPGYQSVYQTLAYHKLQPLSTINSALNTFMNKVAQTSDCHFGFIAYADRAGQNQADSYTAPSVSWSYPVAGNVTIALPQIPLSKNQNNLTQISQLLSPPPGTQGPPPGYPGFMAPNGGNNLADALNQAYNQLVNEQARPGAMKAVVVITDQIPTRDLAGNKYDQTNNQPALNDALTAAQNLGAKGIPIFVIAIDQTPGQQATALMQSQYDPNNTTGIIGAAGNGGLLYMNNWTNNTAGSVGVNGSLNNVIRQLCKIVGRQNTGGMWGGASSSGSGTWGGG